jgi:hypothetical protein
MNDFLYGYTSGSVVTRSAGPVIPLITVFIILLVWATGAGTAIAQSSDTETRQTIEKWLGDGAAKFGSGADASEVIDFYGKKQLGIEYAGGLLDEGQEEKLVVTIDASDCVIYVETTFALALTTLQGSSDWESFRSNLKLLRYRDGTIEGYNSRLHYFSDWMKTNQEKGIFEILHQDQDQDLPLVNKVRFMSANRESYPRLAGSDSLYYLIAIRESELGSHNLYYIPTSRIPEYEKQWKTGDLIGFVSTIDGLDIAHTAIVLKEGDRAGFYHASTTGEVMKDPKTIHEYSSERRNVSGVVIARPVFSSAME